MTRTKLRSFWKKENPERKPENPGRKMRRIEGR
jgi:hypothetical protein